MGKKNALETVQEDKQKMLACMGKALTGDYTPIDESMFHDPEIAQRYNQVLTAFLKANNRFVMKLNDSMTRIGDSTCVKEMLEDLDSQTIAINDMKDASQEMGNSIENIVMSVQSVQQNTHEALEASSGSVSNMERCIEIVDESSEKIGDINQQVHQFEEKMVKITEIIDMVNKVAQKSGLLALNASIEAARAGEAGKGFAVVANEIKDLSANTTKSTEVVVKYVAELKKGMGALISAVEDTKEHLSEGAESVRQSVNDMSIVNEKINSVTDAMDNISNEVQTQSALTENFLASVETITSSYNTLSQECLSTGEHLYQISRDVDKARGDMARFNSKLTTLDWIRIYEVDHLIFTWRVYNNLSGFETLKITQLNNPNGCKFGKWINEQTDPRITESKEFREIRAEHEKLHAHCCDSWYAKEEGDKEAAMRHFELAYECYQRFLVMIHKLRKVIRATGDTEESGFAATVK